MAGARDWMMGVSLGVLHACGPAAPVAAPAPAQSVALAPSAAAPSADPQPPRAPAPGTRELVVELRKTEQLSDARQRWFGAKQTLEAIHALADPRGADALAAYVESSAGWPGDPERVYRRTQAAFALAELGDLRALPVLAARLELDPLDLYREEAPGEAALRRSDQERITAARLIGDLAVLHPEALSAARRTAVPPVLRWIDAAPAPHANGLRALARMQVDDAGIRSKLRAWSDPAGALPRPGAMPPFEEKWVVAQTALRYLGALRDDQAWPILEKQLTRKPKTLDASLNSLLAGGTALLGMTVRALAYGASEGFAEWGDARATAKLLAHVDDDRQNEQSRIQACRALGFVANTASELQIEKRFLKWESGKDQAAEFRTRCLLVTLRVHPIARLSPRLLARSVGAGDAATRATFAAALGHAGLDSATEARLTTLLASADQAPIAAVALLLGGSPSHGPAIAKSAGTLDALASAYQDALPVVTEQDLTSGRLFRWVENARALSRERRGERVMDFAELGLSRHLGDQVFDAGPHSLTRTLLRARLFARAKSGTLAERDSAVDALALARERGVLLALAEGDGPTAERAANAAARLLEAASP